jgi:acyl-CoA thioesterase-1
MVRWLLVLLLVLPGHARAGEPVILVMGDSLSAAYGLRPEQGWVALLEARLVAEKFRHRVVNASISGETSAGGASRIDGLLNRHRPRVLILALGANDGLRGLPVAQLRANLGRIMERARRAGVKGLVVGMHLPPNYGGRYAREFQDSYAVVARDHRGVLAPFLLQGFAADPAAFQADGLHPTAAVQGRMLDNLWPVLKPLLR